MKIRIGLARAAAEGAKLATNETNIGEIDVAIHNVADDIADQIAPKPVRGYEQGEQVGAIAVQLAVWPVAVGQSVAFFIGQAGAVLRFQYAFQRAANRWRSLGRNLVPGQRVELFEF
jgi:hypothetical protein